MDVTGQDESLLDIKIAEASRLYKFYLNQEKKILGTLSVALFLLTLGTGGEYFPADQSHVYERAVARLESGRPAVRIGRDLE